MAVTKREQTFINKFNERYGNYFIYIGGYNSGEHNKIIVKCKQCGYERERGRKKIFDKENVSCPVCNNNRRGYTTAICKECGKTFEQYSVQQVLCKECHTKVEKEKQRTHKRLREARATKNGKVDYSITLSKLIERDNRICQLCGREVNESDYVYIGDTFIAGNDYPSIDHIKPLSKGGVHQWNNVQLAHRLCNSIKCDKENIK